MKIGRSKKGHNCCKKCIIIVCFVGVICVIIIWGSTLEILMEDSAVLDPTVAIINDFNLNEVANLLHTIPEIENETLPFQQLATDENETLPPVQVEIKAAVPRPASGKKFGKFQQLAKVENETLPPVQVEIKGAVPRRARGNKFGKFQQLANDLHNRAPFVKCSGEPQQPVRVEVAGTFNSGTNWLKLLLTANFRELSFGNGLPGYESEAFEPDVMWKHAQLHRLKSSDQVMKELNYNIEWEKPNDRASTFWVVIYKDPLSWLRSMTKSSYGSRTERRLAPGTVIWDKTLIIDPNDMKSFNSRSLDGEFRLGRSLEPFLTQVTQVGHEVFISAVDAWCSFYKNYLFSFGKVDAEFLNSNCGKNDLNVDEIPCWNGVLVDFNELIADPAKVLARLREAFEEIGIVKREVPLSEDQAMPKNVWGERRWEKIDGYWLSLNAAPNSQTSYEAAKKSQVDKATPKNDMEKRIFNKSVEVLNKMQEFSVRRRLAEGQKSQLSSTIFEQSLVNVVELLHNHSI